MFTQNRVEGDINQTPQRQTWQNKEIGQASQALLEEDARLFLHQAMSTPCLNTMRAAEGIYVEDLERRRYMDFHGNSVHQVGFGNQTVIEAIKAQLDRLSFCTRRYTNETAVEFAKLLTDLAPGRLNRVLLTPSGTLATGMAIKLARVATGRHKTIAAWGSFHGASLDMIGVGGSHDMRYQVGPLTAGAEHVPYPSSYRPPWGGADQVESDFRCARYIETILEQERDIAAVILETVRGDMSFPSKEFWQSVRTACTRHGTLLILDEIPWGLGRTGTLFACDHYGIEPDILVLGKGLGGGVMPLAALIARDGLNVAAEQSIGHYTHEKNPVACAAGLATLNYIVENDLPGHARRLGQHALSRLRRMKARYSIIGDVRGLGLMLGIELVRNRATKMRATDEAEQVMYLALEKGLSFKVTQGNILTLVPPLIITEAQLNEALDIIEKCLSEVSNGQ